MCMQTIFCLRMHTHTPNAYSSRTHTQNIFFAYAYTNTLKIFFAYMYAYARRLKIYLCTRTPKITNMCIQVHWNVFFAYVYVYTHTQRIRIRVHAYTENLIHVRVHPKSMRTYVHVHAYSYAYTSLAWTRLTAEREESDECDWKAERKRDWKSLRPTPLASA